MSPKRIKYSIFIACEGQTEERYFNSIGELINDNSNFSVKAKVLEIENGTRQDPVGLVKEAKFRMNEEGHDEAWAVFDKDREVNDDIRKQAFEYAEANQVSIAFSSVAFEHWILLHFEKNSYAFERSDCNSRGDNPCTCGGKICIMTPLLKLFPEYKKGSYKLYTHLSDKTESAIINCAWLKFISSEAFAASPLYKLNPYTTVDNLVIKLLELNKVRYSRIGVTTRFTNLELTVISFENNIINLDIKNFNKIAYVVNEKSEFHISDENDTIFNFTKLKTEIIAPTTTRRIQMSFEIPEQTVGSLFLNFKHINSKLVIELV